MGIDAMTPRRTICPPPPTEEEFHCGHITARQLTDAQVQTCRERRAQGESSQSLAKEYGVSYPTMRAALRGSTYKEAGGPIEQRRPPGQHADNKLSAELAAVIQRRVARGEKQSDLAREYGVAHNTIHYAVKGKTWRHDASKPAPSDRICLNCGKPLRCPPSDKTVTCSKECSSRRKSATHLGKRNEWSEESRQALAAQGQTSNLKLGTPAAQLSPVSGPFETNQEAKIWTIQSPEGEVYTARNLALWCRENAELLAPYSAESAYSGFRQIHLSMNGRTKRPVTTWRGWSLLKVDEPQR